VGEGATATTDRKYAKSGEKVTLYALVEAAVGGEKRSFTEAPLKKGTKASPPAVWPSGCPVSIAWTKLEARPKSYDNSYSAPPAFIEVAETAWKPGWSAVADVHPTLMHDEFADLDHGLGTMRYRVTVTAGGTAVSSPGPECRESGALCRKIHTVAYRQDDTALGYTYELFNTPYIYGSKGIAGGHQTDLLVGADCADLTVYGKRRQRGKEKFPYTYTGGLYKLAKKRVEIALDSESFYVDRKGRRLTFGSDGDVRPGDLFNMQNGHVGMMVKDDGDGFFDTGDFVLHTLFREPEIVPVRDCRWPTVNGKEVLRLKE
jgi:hypothetical protein